MPDAQLCVFCRRQPVDAVWRPFCSERCKLQDLARWADGSYRVPGESTGGTEKSELGSKQDPDQSTG
jgi:endogenous inhibitor of DNA gyrase (YacG/DUF329 family)